MERIEGLEMCIDNIDAAIVGQQKKEKQGYVRHRYMSKRRSG